MTTFFLTCALLGGSVLILQLALSLFGLGGDADPDHTGVDALHGGLDLLSVRALSAGLAAFGLGGLIGMRTPLGVVAGIVLGVLFGAGAAFAVAYAMRSMLRLESDGTLRLENALGASGTVYLGIPAAKLGAGKVHVTVQGRTVELTAVTSHPAALPTGASVVIVDVVGGDVVEVAPEEALLPSEVTDAAR